MFGDTSGKALREFPAPSGIALGPRSRLGVERREAFQAQPADHHSLLVTPDKQLAPLDEATVGDLDLLAATDHAHLEAHMRVVAPRRRPLRPNADRYTIARNRGNEGVEHVVVLSAVVGQSDD